MTKELLNDFDHRQKLSDRYYEEAKDYKTENQKSNPDFRDDPIDCIADPGPSVHDLAFPEPEKLDPRLETLYEAMQHLTDQQIDLIYDLYGSCRSMEDVAEEYGVTRQAIYDRRRKILNRLRKLMEG